MYNKRKQRAIKRVRQVPGTNIIVTIKRIKRHLGIAHETPTLNIQDAQSLIRLRELEGMA